MGEAAIGPFTVVKPAFVSGLSSVSGLPAAVIVEDGEITGEGCHERYGLWTSKSPSDTGDKNIGSASCNPSD